MSRSGYSDEIEDPLELGRWRAQVASAIRGKRGQLFLRELIAALDAMPEKRLIAHELRKGGAVCAIGSVGAARGIDLEALDPENYEGIAAAFGIAHQLVQEIEYENDERLWGQSMEARRWQHMRDWAERNLKKKTDSSDPSSTQEPTL